MLRIFNKIQEK